MDALALNLQSFVATDEQFFELCAQNPDIRFERQSTGVVTMMSPAGSVTGGRNASITGQLWGWWYSNNKPGLVFDSSAGFTLPNGAIFSPDASWIAQDRWMSLSAAEKKKFAPICPDFVIELRSQSDSLDALQAKMNEYMVNGIRLGWLLDPQMKQVYVYRQNRAVEQLDDPELLSGESVLPDFELQLDSIFAEY